MQLDHVAVAVKDLQKAKKIFTDIGLSFENDDQVVESQQVKINFASIGNESKLELLEPLGEGTVYKFIESKGPGVHHISFSVPNIEEKSKELLAAGHKLVFPEPQAGADETLVNFIHPSSTGGILIEISQKA